MRFYDCRVIAKSHPLRDCTTLVLEPPAEVAGLFDARAGQHITVQMTVGNEVQRRSYSVHDGAFNGAPMAITARRVPGGRVSSALFHTVKVGDWLACAPPAGRFVVEPQPEGYRHHYLYAAGTGITPLIAMAQAVLAHEPHSFVSLIYGNRRRSQVLFSETLQSLEARFSDRFTVDHAITAPYSGRDLFTSFTGYEGRVDAAAVAWFLARRPPRAQQVAHYICGPGGMNQAVRAALLDLGAPADRVYREAFGATEEAEAGTAEPGQAAELRVRLGAESATVAVEAGQTLLEALRAAELRPPYSCETGVCGTCVVRLKRGTVTMRASMALSEAEIAAGDILTCQARPTSDLVEIEYRDG